MKKLVAMALALMLLLASAACAESVYVEQYSNLDLNVTSGGESQKVDLSGVTISFAAGMSGEVPTVQMDVTKGDDSLVAGTVQVIDNVLYVGVDGVDTPAAVNLSMGGEAVQEMLASLVSDPEALMNVQLPAFEGVTIPKVDLVELSGLLGVEPETDATGARTAAFSVSAETVSAYLGMISQYKALVPEEAMEYAGLVFDTIDQLVKSGFSFALEGAITDDGATSALQLDVYPASEGVTSDAAAGGLYLAFSENQVNLAVQLYDEGEAMTLAEIALTSEPDAATLSLSLDVMGMVGFQLSLYPVDDAQVVTGKIDAMGETFSGSFTYGPVEGGDFASFAFEAPDRAALSFDTTSVDDGNGDKAGNLALALDIYGDSVVSVALNGDIAQFVADVQLRAVENIENAVDPGTFGEKLGALLGNLMGGVDIAA